jgi:ABC-2 type transport system permease protein
MKIWTIAWKDTLIRFRDRNAVLMMIAAPLLISAIIGAAFGGIFSGSSSSTITDIPFIIVNHDEGELGQTFTDLLTTDVPELVDLLEPTEMENLDDARTVVQEGDTRAVLYIPPDFSEAIQRGGGDTATATSPGAGSPATIQLYTDPTATITPSIIRAIVTRIANDFAAGHIAAQTTADHLVEEYIATLGPALADLGTAIASEMQADSRGPAIGLNQIIVGESEDFNPFAFFVPSMGIFFLVFAMMDGTRSILEEDRAGTLDRLVSTPSSHSEILLGKIFGVFLTGLVQFTVYAAFSAILFDVNWGNSISGIAIMTVTTVAAFTSLGAFIAAFARDATQAGIFGSITAMASGALGGNFTSAFNFPPWLDIASKFTINRWGLDGFTDLTLFGLGVKDILPEAGVLVAITIVFFALGLWQFQRRIKR